ncbi:hypothetical protein [Planctomycetes bacterium TBK1r]|uniref:Uncharacterized protein n=1 Tax=Stieleria magnilauensis TaxID=2527963 RepID=A0ABX5XSH2_9BACT|nr:hypothetical protein TBK1r_39000 [Planctomycetes bacterium TBK1r]
MRLQRQRVRNRALRPENLEPRMVLSANPLIAGAAESGLHVVPFEVNGGGPAPGGIPLFPGVSAEHFATGQATRLGEYSGSASFEIVEYVPLAPTGTFKSDAPFEFTASNGDKIVFDYGAEAPGVFSITPQADGNIVVEFVAEFTLVPGESTGRFAKYTDGSFTMIAVTEPFSGVPLPTGFTVPFDYSWTGEGSISYPVGSVFEVTTLADDGPGSLREAIEEANDTPGIDTIEFAEDVSGKIALESQLVIQDDLTILGPGARELKVSGEHDSRVFSIDPYPLDVPFGALPDVRPAVEIHDLTIANGLAGDAPGIPTALGFPAFAFGGGIYNRGGDLVLESVSMTHNQAGIESSPLAAGGAIANEFGGTISVNESSFVGNRAVAINVAAGGAITQDVGPTPDGTGTRSAAAVVTDSKFTRNVAEAIQNDPEAAVPFEVFAGFGMGGGIFNLASDLFVLDSSFKRNQAIGGEGVGNNAGGPGVGGAIFSDDFSPFVVPEVAVPGQDARVFVEGSDFSNNRARGGAGSGEGDGGNGYGGAVAASISFFPDAGELTDNDFRRNTAQGGQGGRRGGDGGSGVGGGVAALAGASLQIDAGVFVGNAAKGGNGGRGGDGGNGLGGGIGLSLLDTSVASPFEGFPFIPAASVNDTLLLRNRAVGGNGGRGGDGGNGLGGAIGSEGGATALVDEAIVLFNAAVGGRGHGRSGDGGDGLGGGIYNGDATTVLTGSQIRLNAAWGGRGGRFFGRGDGLGGGIYNAEAGSFSIDTESLRNTRWNILDDIFGDLDLLEE